MSLPIPAPTRGLITARVLATHLMPYTIRAQLTRARSMFEPTLRKRIFLPASQKTQILVRDPHLLAREGDVVVVSKMKKKKKDKANAAGAGTVHTAADGPTRRKRARWVLERILVPWGAGERRELQRQETGRVVEESEE